MDRIWYATREQVMEATDTANTARSRRKIDRAIASASRAIDLATGRRFYPMLDTRKFDWPALGLPPTSPDWMLLLDEDEAISISAVASGGIDLTTDQWIAYPPNAPSRGMPYTNVQINFANTGAFSVGDTSQNSIEVTGVFGYPGTDELCTTVVADSSSTVDVAGAGLVGVGSILLVGDERLVVTGRSQLAVGVTLGADLDNKPASTLVQLSGEADIDEDEVILVDGEKMLVTDVVEDTLVVKRAWDGTATAAHASDAALYAPRRLQVQRGALGTAQATHAPTAPVAVWQVAEFVNEWCVAEALVNLGQQKAGYAAIAGSGENAREARGFAVTDVRTRALAAYQRMERVG